jgi:SDR family mycofactocin-dependent oxidoreductase
MGRVEGKVALITGAARGLGRSHAVALAKEGADIIAFDACADVGNFNAPPSTKADLDETVRLVEATGRRIVARVGDVRDAARLQEVVDEGVAELGHLDVVVGNAAIGNFGTAWDITFEDWKNHIDVNLTGNFNLMKAVTPTMREAGRGGSIIFIGSMMGNRGTPLNIHYVSSKHGLVGFARALAAELAQDRIRVNNVHPGHAETPLGVGNAEAVMPLMAQEDHAHLRHFFEAVLPIDGGFIQPIDISNAVVYLASDESRYVTGVVLQVDAGLSL